MMMYLSSNAHPKIKLSVYQCARFTHCPRSSHEEAVKHICRYLQGVKGKGLTFQPNTNLQIDCYVDADFSGLQSCKNYQDPVCLNSRTVYVLTLGGCPIQRSSKLQSKFALSNMEAKYIALSQGMPELIPLRRLLLEIVEKMELKGLTIVILKYTVFDDNNRDVATANAVKMT